MPSAKTRTPAQRRMAAAWKSKAGLAMAGAMKKLGASKAWRSKAGAAFKKALKK